MIVWRLQGQKPSLLLLYEAHDNAATIHTGITDKHVRRTNKHIHCQLHAPSRRQSKEHTRAWARIYLVPVVKGDWRLRPLYESSQLHTSMDGLGQRWGENFVQIVSHCTSTSMCPKRPSDDHRFDTDTFPRRSIWQNWLAFELRHTHMSRGHPAHTSC